ncbi:MAG TPA: tetratricopeptide repeat protein, partial [Burkholderiales bacterium]
ADHAFKQGGDPGPMLDQAIRHLTRGVQTMPDNISAHNNLGNALLSLAEYAPKQGRDPAPHAEQAIAAFRRALALRPDYALPHYNIAYAMRIVAEDRARRGLDASAQWKTAREELDAYDRLAPGDPDSRDLREKIERAASGI